MKIELFKSLEGVTEYYGTIPESYNLPESQVESKFYAMPKNLEALSDLAMDINDRCATLLDISDVDFLDASQCKLLLSYLESVDQYKNEELAPFITDLTQYAKKAIELGTGIVVEL